MTTIQKKDIEISFFDKFGNDLDYNVFDKRGYDRVIKELLKHIDTTKKLKIVDFGCGTGAFTAQFLAFPFELHGIDISSKCIDYAKVKYPQINFTVGDVEKTNFADNSFDLVLCSGLLHHFPDFKNVLQEVYRILKVGGILIAYDPHKNNPAMWLYRVKESPFYSSKGVTENEHPLTIQEIESSLGAAGFSQMSVYSISGVTYRYIESKIAYLILPLYNFFERLLDIKPLRQRFGSFLITTARK